MVSIEPGPGGFGGPGPSGGPGGRDGAGQRPAGPGPFAGRPAGGPADSGVPGPSAGTGRGGSGGFDASMADTGPIDPVRPSPWSEVGLNQPGLVSAGPEKTGSEPAAGQAEPADASGSAGDGTGTGDDEDSDEPRSAPSHRARLSPRQQTANAVMVLAALAALFLLGHRFLPDTAGLASMAETWLPWFAVPVTLLLIGALALRSWRAVIAASLAAVVWLGGYGPTLLHGGGAGPGNLMIFSQDLNGDSGAQLAAAGSAAIGKSAALVAIEGMDPQLAASSSTARLDGAYAYHVTQYDFGVWSRYPVSDAEPIDVAVTTNSSSSAATAGPAAADVSTQVVVAALRLQVSAPQGQLTVYVVHLPQAVAGEDGFGVVRNAAITSLVSMIGKDTADRMALIGDFNTAATDREFSDLTKGLGLSSAQAVAGSGFGFTWPSAFPVVRLDDVLFRGASAVSSSVLPAISNGATHRPILVDLKL